MGRLILCTGKRASKPFVFNLTNTEIYSIEELSYYLYENIDTISVDMFDQRMCDWVLEELEMEDLAERLRIFKVNRSGLKEIVIGILCSSNYYTELEIKELMKRIDKILLLPYILREKLKADNYMKYGSYAQAGRVYENMLHLEEVKTLTEINLGDIMHNQAIIRLHTSSFLEASKIFVEAYHKNRREESLQNAYFALSVGEYSKELRKLCEEECVTLLQKDRWDLILVQQIEEATNKNELDKINKLKDSGKVSEYYEKINQIILTWKKKYREEVR